MLEEEYEQTSQDSTGTISPKDAERVTFQEEKAKYEPHAQQIHASVLGDNMGVVNNYHYTSPSLQDMAQFLDVLGLTVTTRDSSLFTASQKDMWERFGEELQAVADVNKEENHLPEQMGADAMPAEIDEWFYALDNYERYYVVSAALLQGTSATDVALQARKLYQTCCFASDSSQAATQLSTDGAIPSRSVTKLRKRTYTLVSQSGGVPRLFWQNVAFGIRVLRFIAEESIEWSAGQSGQSFLDLLQKWPEELTGECSRRSARTLGVLLAYQSINQLWRTANVWANSEDDHHQHLAALLLSSAYEAGYAENDQKISYVITDSVIRLLQQWTERFAQTSNTHVACAAARTYSLIAKKTPEVALKGVERLLQQPVKKIQNVLPRKLIASLASVYVALAWSGHIRLVLDALAVHTEQWSHQHYLPAKEYQKYRQQREMILNVTFDAFFLVAASSLAVSDTVSSPCSKGYSIAESLPASPILPDHSGRDVLLAGILMRSEPRWYLNMSMLLCSAILEKRNKAAFDLLYQWAEIISDQSGDTAELLRVAFVSFMVNLGQRLRDWCRDLETKGMARKALETYKEKLAMWGNEGQANQTMSMLVQDVLLLVS